MAVSVSVTWGSFKRAFIRAALKGLGVDIKPV